jgi:hypothetical protein
MEALKVALAVVKSHPDCLPDWKRTHIKKGKAAKRLERIERVVIFAYNECVMSGGRPCVLIVRNSRGTTTSLAGR